MEENVIGVSTAKTIIARETITSVEVRKQREKELKEKWSEKRMHGQFIRKTTKAWQWLPTGDLKVGEEALLCAAQEQAIRTNYIRNHISESTTPVTAPCVDCVGEEVKVCNT